MSQLEANKEPAYVEAALEFLEHHGVKGQKWGVRRSKIALARASKEHVDSSTSRTLNKKKRRELSNAELKVINERMNLEQNHRRLNPTRVQQGHSAVKALVAVGGTGLAVYKMINSEGGQAAIARGQRAINRARGR